VVLDVKLRFGSRRMLLRDVLALSAGVVVELDNNLNSPVDLLLDGRLVAQGEVVVRGRQLRTARYSRSGFSTSVLRNTPCEDYSRL
jgi:flagellar motor switch/type III secretory pathway protein FliN